MAAEIEALIQTDKAFARWMRKLRNEVTRADYYKALVPFLNTLKLTPQTFIDQYKAEGEVRENMLDTVEMALKEIEQVHMATAIFIHATMVSLLKHNGTIIGAAAFELPAPKRTRIEPQYIPKEEEYETVKRFAPKSRNKFYFAFLRESGVRRGVLDDPAPMTLRNVLDLDFTALEKGEIKFARQTSCAILIYATWDGAEIARTPETYITYILPSGMQLLKDYLESRLRDGEKLTPDSYLFTLDKTEGTKGYLTDEQAGVMVIRTMYAAGFTIKKKNPKTGQSEDKPKYSSKSFRPMFYNSLSGIDDIDKEALMGHIKGIQARYHGTIDDLMQAKEFMRAKYEHGMRTVAGVSDEQTRMNMLLDFVRTMGLPEQKIEAIKREIGRPMRLDALRSRLRKEFEHLTPHATDGGSRFTSKIVSKEELIECVNAGWEIVKELSDGAFVVKLPNHTSHE